MTASATAEMSRPGIRRRLRPVPALDGLRGLAVAVVVLFHFPTTTVFPGGMFGVDVFFVLSGFLVTAGLLDEHDERGRISLARFLARRGRRLLPALLAFLVVFLLVAGFYRNEPWFSSDPFGQVGPAEGMSLITASLAAVLSYGYNFVLAFSLPTAMPLAHLWSLAIEGQFYVGWALLLRGLLRHRPDQLLRTTLALIAGSAVLPFVLWDGGDGANQIYFGTGPRLQQLLMGAVVAQLWRSGALDRIPARTRAACGTVGAAVLAFVCLTIGDSTFKFLGAQTVVPAATALVIAHLVTASGSDLLTTVLSESKLRWLGTRSYAIYLWHWPLALWTNPLPEPAGIPLGIAGSLVLAEASWRLVEKPVQRWRKVPVPSSACQ